MTISKFFIKTETFLNESWASASDSFNTEYKTTNWPPKSLEEITPFQSRLDYYIKIDNKVRLYQHEGSLILSVAEPTTLGELNIGMKELDLSKVRALLANTDATVVFFGYPFSGLKANQIETVQNTTYIVRKTDGSLLDIEANKAVEDSTPVAVWIAFYKLKGAEIYYGVMNNNLVDNTGEQIFKIEDKDIICSFMNSPLGTMSEFIFEPSFDGATLVNGNTLIVSDSSFTVNTLGNSGYFFTDVTEGKLNAPFEDAICPKIKLLVDSDLSVLKKGNSSLTVNMNEDSVGYLKYTWDSGTPFSNAKYKNETLKREYIVIRKK